MRIPIPCPQWTDCNNPGGGCCAKGLFGGRPTRVDCEACLRGQSLPIHRLRGAVGIIKAAMGMERAPDAEIDSRHAVCMACPERIGEGLTSRCGKCRCLILVKIRLARQLCPVGKWGIVQPQTEAA